MNVAYRKTSHPKRPEDGQGWTEAEVNDTLNAFDSGETRTPTLVLENHPQDSRLKIKEDGIFQTMGARGGQEYEPHTLMVLENNMEAVVRRLTPMECERLQGYPAVREVRCTEMTKDEYIAWNISEGNIIVDTENGKVFRTRGPGGTKLSEPVEMPGTDLNGYYVVNIRNGKTKIACRVHRIVWIAARGVIPDGYVVDHINNDKHDNRLINLQLLTAEDNSHKAKADGLYRVHENNPASKITDEVHDVIQYIYGTSDVTIKQLSEMFGISKSRVHQIIHEDGWTDIGEWTDSRGKKHKDADSPRYKALGNSIALPFWEWMAGRICKQYDRPVTMASLFDGISGFPLVFSRHGAEPVWASEVEEFCIAVTKRRFPDVVSETTKEE